MAAQLDSIRTSRHWQPPTQGWVLIVKRNCPTCTMLAPIVGDLVEALNTAGTPVQIFSQDDAEFLSDMHDVVFDDDLHASYHFNVETVPTLIHLQSGTEQRRVVGWQRDEWRDLTGIDELGESLPPWAAGCGSMSVSPGMAPILEARFGNHEFVSRSITVPFPDDPIEACYQRGWSDGLPVVPPTPARVLTMLEATSRASDEIVGIMPPGMGACSIEKIAVNAVMAGCRPEYLPVVIAAVEAVLKPAFCLHGTLCTTDMVGPIVIVNGPIAARIGINCGVNVLGQGTRANSTIGRALQLVIRNVGGGRPGEIDRATIGQPGKTTCCFGEIEGDGWQSLAMERGFSPHESAVTVFAGAGVQGLRDERSRTPDALVNTMARSIAAIGHPKRYGAYDCLLVISPEHHAIFDAAGWSRAAIKSALLNALTRPAQELIAGVDGIPEGLPVDFDQPSICKVREEGLLLTRAGGPAGLDTAIIAGWAASGERGSDSVTVPVA